MPIAVLSYGLHTGCVTTSPEKSLRHNKTDCIITFFSPYRVHFYSSSHHLQREETAGVHSDEWEGEKKTEQGCQEAQSIPIFLCVC